MGRAFEYRKAAKLKRWGHIDVYKRQGEHHRLYFLKTRNRLVTRTSHMGKTFTRPGKQIAIAVKAGGPEPENNPTLRSVIATCKRENMPKDNICLLYTSRCV